MRNSFIFASLIAGNLAMELAGSSAMVIPPGCECFNACSLPPNSTCGVKADKAALCPWVKAISNNNFYVKCVDAVTYKTLLNFTKYPSGGATEYIMPCLSWDGLAADLNLSPCMSPDLTRTYAAAFKQNAFPSK